jgi:hypothetical protein
MRQEKWAQIALAAAFLIVALAGQAVGDRIISTPADDTTAVVGRASLSYLTGVRRYAGALLWNRIDPLLHGYYHDVPLDDQRYMLSSIAAVEWLDPTFDQPYYVGAWILARNGKVEEGLTMARVGTENVPDSGTLHMSYAQMLLVLKKDNKGAVDYAKLAIQPGMRWTDDLEKLNGYAAINNIFVIADETELSRQLQPEIDRLDALVGDQPLEHEE